MWFADFVKAEFSGGSYDSVFHRNALAADNGVTKLTFWTGDQDYLLILDWPLTRPVANEWILFAKVNNLMDEGIGIYALFLKNCVLEAERSIELGLRYFECVVTGNESVV